MLGGWNFVFIWARIGKFLIGFIHFINSICTTLKNIWRLIRYWQMRTKVQKKIQQSQSKVKIRISTQIFPLKAENNYIFTLFLNEFFLILYWEHTLRKGCLLFWITCLNRWTAFSFVLLSFPRFCPSFRIHNFNRTYKGKWGIKKIEEKRGDL